MHLDFNYRHMYRPLPQYSDPNHPRSTPTPHNPCPIHSIQNNRHYKLVLQRAYGLSWSVRSRCRDFLLRHRDRWVYEALVFCLAFETSGQIGPMFRQPPHRYIVRNLYNSLVKIISRGSFFSNSEPASI